MGKSVSKDSQIILNMMRVQDSMSAILKKYNSDSAVCADSSSVDLLHFYILKMYSMRKRISGKTKGELRFFSDFVGNVVSKDMLYCYPTVSAAALVRVARTLCDDVSVGCLTDRYALCITESDNYVP